MSDEDAERAAPGETFCVYTALIGEHEGLNEQPVAKDSNVPFICLTDDRSLTSDTWEIRHVSPVFACDTVRSQREIKLRPHKYLQQFDASIYIDNSVVLKSPAPEIFRRYRASSGFSVAQHSFRDTVSDEFIRVYLAAMDDQSRIMEQMNHYATTDPLVFDQQPYWGAIQIRDHRNTSVQAVMELWFAHVLRYSRRDQLSLNFVLNELKFRPDVMSIDNRTSWFHSWPVRSRVVVRSDPAGDLGNLAPLLIKNRLLERELKAREDAARAIASLTNMREYVRRIPVLGSGAEAVVRWLAKSGRFKWLQK